MRILAPGCVKGHGRLRRVCGESAERPRRVWGETAQYHWPSCVFLRVFSVTLRLPWSSKNMFQAIFSGLFGPCFRTLWHCSEALVESLCSVFADLFRSKGRLETRSVRTLFFFRGGICICTCRCRCNKENGTNSDCHES